MDDVYSSKIPTMQEKMSNSKASEALKEKLKSAIEDESKKRFNLIWNIIEDAIKKAGEDQNRIDFICGVVKNTLRDGDPLYWDIEIRHLIKPITWPFKIKGSFQISTPNPSNENNWVDDLISDENGKPRGLIFANEFTKICNDCTSLPPQDAIKCTHDDDNKNNDKKID